VSNNLKIADCFTVFKGANNFRGFSIAKIQQDLIVPSFQITIDEQKLIFDLNIGSEIEIFIGFINHNVTDLNRVFLHTREILSNGPAKYQIIAKYDASIDLQIAFNINRRTQVVQIQIAPLIN